MIPRDSCLLGRSAAAGREEVSRKRYHVGEAVSEIPWRYCRRMGAFLLTSLLFLPSLFGQQADPGAVRGDAPAGRVPGHGSAREVALSPEDQVEGVLKILLFDRRLMERMGQDTLEMAVGIAYVPDDVASVEEMQGIETAFGDVANPFDWIGLRAKPIPYRDPVSFRRHIREENVHFLWVVTVGTALGPLLEEAAREELPTLTGVPGYVEQGVAMGMVGRRVEGGEGGVETVRHQIQVNQRACEEASVELKSQLLKLAVFPSAGEPE